MFLSDRDIKYAVQCGTLVIKPEPTEFDANSVDLHLDKIASAKVWDIDKFRGTQAHGGSTPDDDAAYLQLGTFKYNDFADQYLAPIPVASSAEERRTLLVHTNGIEVFVRPNGFLLWTTEEVVGTPERNPELLSFVNAKSTKARTGIMVHFTAPTINSGWQGKITLEIVNLGPFTFVLRPGDAIAQLTVARLTSSPDANLFGKKKSSTHGQTDPGGKRSS